MNSKELLTTTIWELLESLQWEKQMESALTACLLTIRKATGAEAGFVWLLNRDTERLTIAACATEIDVTGMTIERDQGAVGQVLTAGQSLILSSPVQEGNPLFGSDEVTGIRIWNQMIVPLRTPGSDPFGCIQLVNKRDGCFEADELHITEKLTALISMDLDDKGYDLPEKKTCPPMISLRNVVKEFASGEGKIRVLKGICLDIYPQEFLVILGESGCGKTTLMNIIGGMDSLTEGTMLVDGKDFSHPGSAELTAYRRNEIGYIFQAYHLMPNLSALENLEFIAEIVKNPMLPRKALELVGLTDRANNFPSQMSGGQQQRVSIARALVKQPRLILADEPTAALDYATSIEVLTIVEDIVRNQGKTVVMITHNPEIAKMADRVVRLSNGRISSIQLNMNPLPAKELSW